VGVVIWIGQARLALGGAALTGRLVVRVRQLASRYQLHEVRMRHLGTPVNDVFAVTSAEGEFALKLYHRNRTPSAVQWEIDLLTHLHNRWAPVVQPIRGRNGYLEQLRSSAAYLQAWLAGYRTARPFSAADEAAVAAFGSSVISGWLRGSSG
jgi:Ser/Thr protein kinase RdoA (MazF antagonist)